MKLHATFYKNLLSILLFSLISINVKSQYETVVMQEKITINGIVTDWRGQPLIGAAISTRHGYGCTDVNGKFTMSLFEGDPIRIVYIGYKDVDTYATSEMVIKMKKDPYFSYLNNRVIKFIITGLFWPTFITYLI